jgi:hypothetical protein
MFRTTVRYSLMAALLMGSSIAPIRAQTVPPVMIRDQQMAKSALKEVNAGLQSAVRKGQREPLLAAIAKFQEVMGALAALEYTGLSKDLQVTRGLYHQALGTLTTVLVTSCENGQVVDGLSGADILRAIDSAAVSGIGTQRVKELRERLSDCLRLTLEIDSSMKQEGPMNYWLHVEVKVPLTYNLAGGYYTGEGTVTVLKYSATPPKCQVDHDNRKAYFAVRHLVLNRIDDTHLGDVLLDDYLVWQKDVTSALICPAPAGRLGMPWMNWGFLFKMARDTTTGTSISGWQFDGSQATLASKNIEQVFGEAFKEGTLLILRQTGHKR